MRYIEAPSVWNGEGFGVFMAGGITGCPDWQAELRNMLEDSPVVLLNPRRGKFEDNPLATQAQIFWEHEHLSKANAVSFWFPCETLCPITLYELGKCSAGQKPLIVGVHPDYKRRLDVETQTALSRPEVTIHTSLSAVAMEIDALCKKSVTALHQEAMAKADELVLSDIGAEAKRQIATIAYREERAAADRLSPNPNNQPSRSILYKSAGWLAIEAGLWSEAVECGYFGRRGVGVPPEIIKELQEITERGAIGLGNAVFLPPVLDE